MSSNNGPTTAAPHRSMFVRVEDAAQLLGISRSFAYDMANLWIKTGGTDGLPAVRLGRRLLVQRAALERWANADRGTSTHLDADR